LLGRLGLCRLVIALISVLCCRGAFSIGSPEPRLKPEEAAQRCLEYEALYSNIGDDLSRWKENGISLELMQRTIELHTTRTHGQKGFAAGFWNGKAYLIDAPEISKVGHHATLLLVYMKVLLFLEEAFEMPDVDFVINTIDRPLGLHLNASEEYEPVLRFCKTNSHADVSIPIFHFHMKYYDESLIDKVPEINEKYPWENKKEILFGRFSLYSRHVHTMDPAAPARLGAGGVSICNSSKVVTACHVRAHFIEWAKSHKKIMDVSNGGKIAMADHAKYKYLVHMDGQGLSSRLDQLLPLNSLIFKEESGYKTFYHHLLKPGVHYVPFWKKQPDEILDALKWAHMHDNEAKTMAAAGQQVALKYLNRHARACYWYMLLLQFSKMLRYKPGKVEGRQYMQYYMTVQQYIETIGRQHEGGKHYRFIRKHWRP